MMKSMGIGKCKRIVSIVLLLGLGISLSGAIDMFIKIEGVEGESKDEAHRGEIDVLAWSWGVSNIGSGTVGGGGGAGKADFQDLSLTKYLDKSSPKLMEACASGQPLPEAILVLRSTGEQPLEYLVIRMENVLVTSVSTGGSGGEDRLTENVTLNYAKIEVKYTESTPDGTAGAEVNFGWDVELNTPIGSGG